MKLRSASKDIVFEQAVYVKSSSKNVAEFTPEFFDESSRAWKANKIEVAKGIYKYKKDDRIVEPRRSERLAKKAEEVQPVRRSARLATK